MEPQYNEATVAELLSITRKVLDDERARGQGLDSKSATLAGFTGTILALTATLGAQLLELDLGSVGTPVFQCLFILSVLALGAAALIALLGVLRPQVGIGVALEEIRSFSAYPLISRPTAEVQGMMINTLIEAIEFERRINERKSRLTRYAAASLTVGFISVAAQAVTLGLAA